jgi:hypothetical protein
MGYIDDRKWSDAFVPELRRLIGPHLLVPSSLEQDRTEAADLVILKARDVTIACRLRRAKYATKYAGEFTIRCRRDNGAKTELAKIADGWADWFFYGFADDGTICPWWLLDLSVFRAHFIREGLRKEKRIRWGERANGDGTYFCWFQIASFQGDPPLVIASSHPDPLAPLTAADIPWGLT